MRSALAMPLLLCGCASQPEKPAPAAAEAFPALPGMTNGVVISAPAIVQQPPAPVPVVMPALIYPPDASNHVWHLQESPDLVSWTNFAGPFQGQPGGEFVISNQASPSFWRMESDQRKGGN
jgi:hypothetical protein